MKNIATGLLWFTAGVALTVFFTKGSGRQLVSRIESITGDEPVTEKDMQEAVERVKVNFKNGHAHSEPA